MEKNSGPQAAGSSQGGVFDCRFDRNYTLLWAKESLFELIGYSKEEFRERFHNCLMGIIYEDDREYVRGEIEKQLSHSDIFMCENRIRAKGGKLYWIWISGELMKDRDQRDYFHCIFHDITQEKENREKLALSERRYEIVLSQTKDIVFEMDCSTNQVYYSPNFEEKFGYQIPLENFPEALFTTDIVYEEDKPGLRKRFQDMYRGRNYLFYEYRLKISQGTYLWVEVRATAIRDKEGRLQSILGIIKDIDRRKQEILRAREVALNDPLTNLLNRRECIRRIASYTQDINALAAFLLIDVDNFKRINDTLGHSYGDTVLLELAACLKAVTGKEDIAARLGGDEFVVFLANAEDKESIRRRVLKTQRLLSRSFCHDDMHFAVSCSIGVSFFPSDGIDFSELFEKADAAMYSAKRKGKDRFCIYEEVEADQETRLCGLEDPGRLQSEFIPQGEIAHRELVYQTALKKTQINVWEYDVQTHSLIMMESSQGSPAYRKRIENVPESLGESGFIHPNSVREVMELHEKLERGEPSAQTDILMLGTDNKNWCWARISYTLLYKEDGQPAFAVVIGEDISGQKQAEMLYQQELKMRMSLSEGMLLSFRCNLDNGRIEYIEGSSSEEYRNAATYEELQFLQKGSIAKEEDHIRFLKAMNRKALLKAYSEGRTRVSCEYRRCGHNGRLSWTLAVVQLVRDVQSGELYAYGTLQDIDEKKKIELALKFRAERDATTGTYNKETTIQMIENAIRKVKRENSACAFLVVNIDNFTQIVHNSGYQAADKVLRELAGQLLTRFTDKKIIGRLYGDEFVVFIYGNPNRDKVLGYAEEVRKSMAMPYMFPDLGIVSISVGIAFDPCIRSDFNILYKKSRKAISAAKDRGRNCCVVYTEKISGAEYREEAEEGGGAPCANGPQGQEMGNLLLKCLFCLNSTMDFGSCMDKILENSGKYFKGDRACVLVLGKDGQTIQRTYEWRQAGAPSISESKELGVRLAKNLEKFQYKTKKCFYIKDTGGSLPAQLEICSCFWAELGDGREQVGIFLIGNPQANTHKAEAFEALCYLLGNEFIRKDLEEKQEYLRYHDMLTGVCNRNSFREYCGYLNEEELISLGVVSVDINGLKELNRLHGSRYGDSTVQFLASALQEICGNEQRVYRFAGDEFLAVFENISEDAFCSRVKELRIELGRESSSVSIGTAWSDSDIRLESLMDIADERRQICKKEYYNDRNYNHKRLNPDTMHKLLTALGQKKFRIYLQPKINIQNNSLYGAEALVRYQDPGTGVISPGKFVPYLENAGLIYLIDYFVLEEVHHLIGRWKKEGKKRIPISLNFSRSTLLEENLKDRMREIDARNTGDRHDIEIEITESFGEIEHNAIARIGGQIHDMGYQLALDDFGSMYSNLTFLSDLPLNSLKLDKKLVNGLVSRKNSRIIVRNILNLCRELNIEVVAEGVENKEQLDILKVMECPYVQGYYYNKPMPVEEFETRYM